MTAGEQLVSLSGLSGVSAAAHFLAIDTGGSGGTLFTDWMHTEIREDEWSVVSSDAVNYIVSQQDFETVSVDTDTFSCVMGEVSDYVLLAPVESFVVEDEETARVLTG